MKRLLLSLIIGGILTIAGVVRAAPPSSGVNILTNPSFDALFNSWSKTAAVNWDVVDGALEFYAGSAGAIFQTTSYTAAPGDIYEMQLLLGNSSDVPKTLQVQIDDGSGVNSETCNFSIPAETALSPYRMRAPIAGSWAAVRLIMRVTSFDSSPGILLDDVRLFYTPTAQVTTTICTSPTPTPTPTPSPTPTPDTAVVWALPTQVNAEGTPQPAQYARLSYDFTAGELAISVLLAAVLFTALCVFTVWLLIGRNKK